METTRFIKHIPCEACGSRDNAGLYDDGHVYCFGCGAYTPGDNTQTQTRRTKRVKEGLLTEGLQVKSLPARKITEETCRRFGYTVGEYRGKPVQVAPYYDAEGQLVAQKLRFKDKQFKVLGEMAEALPFGSHVWPKTGKRIVVTEGEIDALTMSQVQGNAWPVVSIPNGAQSARRYIAKHRDYFLGFDEVVLMFDMDEPGRTAAKAAAEVLGHRARIARLPLKDPNEMLLAGRTKELINAMWRAEEYRPEGIVELRDLKDKVKEKPDIGVSWWSETLTRLTYGIRLGEIYCFGAGTGVGKTDFFTQQIAHLSALGHACGVFSLEQQPGETAKRLAGKVAGKPFHVPDAGWTEEDIDAAWAKLEQGGRVFLYDSFGANRWEPIREKIEYLVHAFDVRYIFLDHLTALAAAEEDERVALERIMADMGALVKRLNIALFLVSHLATPESGSHEEGARVTIRQFKGSRAIGFWCHYMFGLERNQQAEDPKEMHTTYLRVLKDRYTGRATGAVIPLWYDHETGLLSEKEEEPQEENAKVFTEEEGEGAPSDF